MEMPRLAAISNVLSMEECAAYLGISRRKLRSLINDPDTPIPHHRFGPTDRYPVKFLRHRVDDWRQEHGTRFRLSVPRPRRKPTLADSKLRIVYLRAAE